MNPALVRRALAEYFLEGFEGVELDRRIKSTPEDLRLQALESLQRRRTVPDGCFLWVQHLIWLERMLEIAPVPLSAVEALGLIELKRERNRFQAEHPACPHCGLPNEPHAFTCRECMAEIRSK
jgi:hypothetical protein